MASFLDRLAVRVPVPIVAIALAAFGPYYLPFLFGAVTTGLELVFSLLAALVSGIQALPEYHAAVTETPKSVTAVMEEVASFSVVAALFYALAALVRFIVTLPGGFVVSVRLVPDENLGSLDKIFFGILFGFVTSPINVRVVPWLCRFSYYHLVERPAMLRALRAQNEAYASRIEKLRYIWDDYEFVIGKCYEAIRRTSNLFVQSQKAQEELLKTYRTVPKLEIPSFHPNRRVKAVGAANRTRFTGFLVEVQKLALGPAIAKLDKLISEFDEALGFNRSQMDLLRQEEEEQIKFLTATEQQLMDCRRDEEMRRRAAAFEAETATGRWRRELRDESFRQAIFTPRYCSPARPLVLFRPRSGLSTHDPPPAVTTVANPPVPEVVAVQEERPAAAVDAAVPPVADEPIAAANEPIAASPVVIEESPATPVVPVQVAVEVPGHVNTHLVEASEQREQALPQPKEQYQALQEEWNARIQQQILEQQEFERRQAIAAEHARQAEQLSLDRLRAEFDSAHQENNNRMSAWREHLKAQRAAEKEREAAESEAKSKAEATEREAAARCQAEAEEALLRAREAEEAKAAEAEETRRVREAERLAEAERASLAFAEGLRLAEEEKREADAERLAAEARCLADAERLVAVHAAAKRLEDEAELLEEAECEAEAEEDRRAEAWEKEQAKLRALAGFESHVEAKRKSEADNRALAQSTTDRLRQAEEEQSGEALFLSPGQQLLLKQKSELALIQAKCQALRDEGYGNDVSSDGDMDLDSTPSSPDTTAAPGAVVDATDADAAHEAALDAFAAEEERRWFHEMHGDDVPYNANADVKMAYLDSSSEDSDSAESEDGVEWEDVVVSATTTTAGPSTPAPGRRILPAKAVNSKRVVQTKLNYEFDRQSGLLDALRKGLSRPTPNREELGLSPRLSDEDALKLAEVRVAVSPAEVSLTPEQKKEADRLAHIEKLRATTDRVNQRAKQKRARNALAKAAQPKSS